MSRVSLLRWLVVALVILIVGFPVAGRGNGEDPLRRVDALIDEQRFSDALRLLTQIARDGTHRFSHIQARLRKIQKYKAQKNVQYSDLLETMEVDLRRAYEIVQELDSDSSSDSLQDREVVQDAKETIGLLFNRESWNDIMERGKEQILAGQYWEAIDIYSSGFDLGRILFLDSGFEDSDVAEVEGIVEGALSIVEVLRNMGATLVQKSEQEAELFALGGVVSEEYGQTLLELQASINSISDQGLALKERARLALAKEVELGNLGMGDVHYLIYMSLLILGRPDSVISEGIVGALNRIWQDNLSTVLLHLETALSESFTRGEEHYRLAEYPSSRLAFNEVAQITVLRQMISASLLRGLQMGSSDNPSLNNYSIIGSVDLQREIDIFYSSASREYLQLMDWWEESLPLSNSALNPSILLDEETLLREQFSVLLGRIREGHSTWVNSIAQIHNFLGVERRMNEVNSLDLKLRSEYDHLTSQVRDAGVEFLLAVLARRLEPLLATLDGFPNRFQEAQRYLSGIPITISVGNNSVEIIAPYPNTAEERLVVLQEDLEQLIDRADEERRAVEEEVISFVGREYPLADADSLGSLMQEWVRRLEEPLSISRSEQLIANQLRLDGQVSYEEAKGLFSRGEYSLARERAILASVSFDESLSHQEDAELRRLNSTELPGLIADSNSQERIAVIENIRELITRGRQQYTRNEFDDSLNLFLRAEEEWAQIESVDNPEISYWIGLSENATSITQDREIASTDPLFSEMNQYLNKAVLKYEEGITLTEDGASSSSSAEEVFVDAKRNLLLVQQVFPSNRKARILQLRIEEYRDPDGFQEIFRDYFVDARNQIQNDPATAYIELTDLREIDPDYPGLSEAILTTEYRLGIRIQPPDPEKLARARELYQQAEEILNSNIRTDFPLAVAFLDEALLLAPQDLEIALLRDIVTSYQGATTSRDLSAEDFEQYNEAVSEFSGGNYVRAQILVNQLLENPENRNNTKILELKKRVESVR